MALYHAKDNGRNDYCLFEPPMEEEFLELRKLEAALRVAIEKERAGSLLPADRRPEDGRITCCEALLRWHHPEFGIGQPVRFIPIAESTGLISPISHWVLGQACEAAAKWPEDVTVAVNMSPALLKDLHLPHMILSALYTSGLQARRLELEITESVLLEDNVQSNSLIKEFQKIGLKLSLDDFGTGYSSLTYLKKYRFDKIKIDTSFIADVTRARRRGRSSTPSSASPPSSTWRSSPRASRPRPSSATSPAPAAPPPRASISAARCRKDVIGRRLEARNAARDWRARPSPDEGGEEDPLSRAKAGARREIPASGGCKPSLGGRSPAAASASGRLLQIGLAQAERNPPRLRPPPAARRA
jgi:EAL domain-containing protein (putative c-di-GMP-specific phosphodiesterase class I)